jgi:hypothetical protein
MTKASITPDSNFYYYNRERGRVGTFDPDGSAEDMPKAPHFVLAVTNPQESLTEAFGRLSGFLEPIEGVTGAIVLCKIFAMTPTAVEKEALALRGQNPRITEVVRSPDDSTTSGVHHYLSSRSTLRQAQAAQRYQEEKFGTDFQRITL